MPPALGLAGVAGAGEEVEITLQGETAPPDVREDEFFYHELQWVDDTSDRFEEVTVTAGESELSGRLFVPGNPEVFEYDDDGNLVQDGRWSYSWDAENRLTAVEEIRSAAISGRTGIRGSGSALVRRYNPNRALESIRVFCTPWIHQELRGFLVDPPRPRPARFGLRDPEMRGISLDERRCENDRRDSYITAEK